MKTYDEKTTTGDKMKYIKTSNHNNKSYQIFLNSLSLALALLLFLLFILSCKAIEKFPYHFQNAAEREKPTVSSTPENESAITPFTEIKLTFNKKMDKVNLSGNMAEFATLSWQDDKKILIVKPESKWTKTPAVLLVNGKDATGKSLEASYLSFELDLVSPTYTMVYPPAELINQNTVFVIDFSKQMNVDSFSLAGTIFDESDGGVWSNDNSRLRISPLTTWSATAHNLLFSGYDSVGNPLEETE